MAEAELNMEEKLEHLWLLIFGRPCANAPYGCKRRARRGGAQYGYCSFCWPRGLFDIRRYKAWMGTERIAAAAIKHADGRVFSVPPPGRHHTVIAHMRHQHGIRYADPVYESRHVQGFVTDIGRFVDRYEARKIAEAAGQLLPRECGKAELFSEDVW